jgi:hypothetical protein
MVKSLANLKLIRKYKEMFNETIEKILMEFIKSENSYKDEIEVYMFPQMWGSTALGYSGMGESAMTSSHTIVFHNQNTGNVMLSYGGRFIRLMNPNQLFFDDLFKQRIEPEYKLHKYDR